MHEEEGQAWQAPSGHPDPAKIPGQDITPDHAPHGENQATPHPSPERSAAAPWSAPGAPPPQPGPGAPAASGWAAPREQRGWGAPGGAPAFAPRPGVIALRPLTFGDIFNGAFGYLRNNPKATLGVTFIVVAIVSVLPALGLADFSRGYSRMFDTLLADPSADVELPFSGFSLVGLYGGSLLQLLGAGLLVGLLSGVVGMAVLGHRLSFGAALRIVRGRIATLLGITGLYLVFSVIVVALFAALLGTSIALSAMSPLAGLPLLLLLGPALLVLFAWIGIKTTLAMPIAVLEQAGPLRSLARSWQLTTGSFWRLLGILVLTQLLVQLVASVLSTPFSMGSLFVGLVLSNEAAAAVVSAALAFIGLLLTGCISNPFTAGVTALLYLDLRMRREGLDLRLRDAVRSGAPLGPEVYLPAPRPEGSA